MAFEAIFQPGRMGALTLKNRIVMGPMGNINMADPIGRPTGKMIEYFTERARGGTALLITGLVPVSFGIDPTVSEDNDTTYFPRIDGSSRTRLSGWRDLAAAVHSYDAKILIQLTAGLGRVGSPESALKGKIPKSASWNRNFYVPQVPHVPMSDRAIRKIVENFGQAAVNAKACGLDGVHLHGHEGYLMDQLTSLPWNRRWLGRYRDRFRFALDVIEEIQARCGRDFPIVYRIDLTQALQASYGDSVFRKRFGQERTEEEGLTFCRVLAEAGVAAIDVDKGCYDNWFYPHPPNYFDDIPYVAETAGKVKADFAARKIDVPIIAVGKMGKPEQAESVLQRGWADYVMLARPLLADPYWPRKVREGKVRDIIHCIGDQEGCIQSFLMGGHVCCSVNPYTGFEDTKRLIPADRVKTVAVIGAGPGGCEAARTALARGHQVTLFEQTGQVGGQLRTGSRMRIKHDLALYIDNLQDQMDRLAEEGLDIRYNTGVRTADLHGKYDVIICASGLKGKIPAIPGAETIPHMEVRAFLDAGMPLPKGAERVTVIGGGLVGCEAAYSLAAEKGVRVTVVEMLPELMTGVVHANRAMLLWLMMGRGTAADRRDDRLAEPITAYTASRAVRIEAGRVMLEANRKRWDPYTPWTTLIPENIHNPFKKKLKPDQVETVAVATDFVVFAASGEPCSDLYYELLAGHAAPEIYCIGDARQPARAWEAISAGNEIARSI